MSSINPAANYPPGSLDALLDVKQAPSPALPGVAGVQTVTSASGMSPTQSGGSPIQSWLESQLGSSQAVTQLQGDIRTAITSALQQGGTGADARAAVDNVLQQHGIDPAKFQQQIQAGGGHPHHHHRGYNAQGQATSSGTTQADPATTAVPPGALLSLNPQQRTQA